MKTKRSIQEIIKGFLGGTKYSKTTIHYDMNAIKIHLYEKNSEERYLYFYLYTPWRIAKNGNIINSSALYPYEEEYDSKEKHKLAFKKYYSLTKNLSKIRIKEIAIEPRLNDLRIKWQNGTILDKYCLETNEYGYHIYDNLNNGTYDVYYNRIKYQDNEEMKS